MINALHLHRLRVAIAYAIRYSYEFAIKSNSSRKTMSFMRSKSVQVIHAYGLIIGILSIGSVAAWAETMPSINPNAEPIILPPPPEPKETAPAQPSTPTPAVIPITPIANGSVTRATFTTGIINKEPTDQISRAVTGQKIYYFTELTGLQGHTITHRWERNGNAQLAMTFTVGANRWRVQSSKTLNADAVGNWTVIVQAEDGTVLRKDNLSVDAGQVPATPPFIPPSATPLTPIPPALSKEPATRPATETTTSTTTNNTNTPVLPKPDESSKKIEINGASSEQKEVTAKDTNASKPISNPSKPIWDSL